MPIRCDNCGQMFSSLSNKCAYCGSPTKYYIESMSAEGSKPNSQPSKTPIRRDVELDSRCFKIHSANAFEMINGYRRHGTINHTAT